MFPTEIGCRFITDPFTMFKKNKVRLSKRITRKNLPEVNFSLNYLSWFYQFIDWGKHPVLFIYHTHKPFKKINIRVGVRKEITSSIKQIFSEVNFIF